MMITVHKTEIARQNNTVNIFLFFQITFSGEPVLLSGAPSSPVVRTLLYTLTFLLRPCNKCTAFDCSGNVIGMTESH